MGLFLLFIFGLAHSISTGFAGFWYIAVFDYKSVCRNFCLVRCFRRNEEKIRANVKKTATMDK